MFTILFFWSMFWFCHSGYLQDWYHGPKHTAPWWPSLLMTFLERTSYYLLESVCRLRQRFRKPYSVHKKTVLYKSGTFVIISRRSDRSFSLFKKTSQSFNFFSSKCHLNMDTSSLDVRPMQSHTPIIHNVNNMRLITSLNKTALLHSFKNLSQTAGKWLLSDTPS